MTNPRDLLERWLHYVNKGDIEGLLDLYDSEAVLIPTFSKGILNSTEALRDYFDGLGRREDLSVTLDDTPIAIQNMWQQIFSLSGTYTWRFKVEGEALVFGARFSYVIDLSKISPILHHHSSQIPGE